MIGIEIIEDAIEDAKINAEINGKMSYMKLRFLDISRIALT